MEEAGCGCPPTGDGPAAQGRVHHVIVNVNDVARARSFYDWLLPKLGYSLHRVEHAQGCGWGGQGGSFWIKQAAGRFAEDVFHKDRVGLCEIAFAAPSKQAVDALSRELAERGETILDPPRTYDYVPGYYAVFFTDPDGLKLEYVFIPAKP
jgi:catechol 2,3-dioxygenase-like lactoylglutathione lyase family enzyme